MCPSAAPKQAVVQALTYVNDRLNESRKKKKKKEEEEEGEEMVGSVGDNDNANSNGQQHSGVTTTTTTSKLGGEAANAIETVRRRTDSSLDQMQNKVSSG